MIEPISAGAAAAVPAKPKLIVPTKKDFQLLRFSSLQESDDYTEDVGYSPALFSQVSLPYKDPKDSDIWVRRNGDVTLQVTPRSVVNEETGLVERRFPFGILPRLFVTFLSTEAKKNNSRTVELGGSLTAFLRYLGMAHTGENAKRVRDHLQRFFGSTILFEGKKANNDGEGTKTVFFQFASEMSIWDNAPQEGDIVHRAPWQNEVILSEAFYTEIHARPVPIDLNVLRQLGGSPLKADVYLWLTHRMSWLEREQQIKWKTLELQFGAQYKEPRQFRAAFLTALDAVKKVYTGLDVTDERDLDVLIIKPSPTSIRKTSSKRRSKLEFTGDKFPDEQQAIES